MAGTIIDRLIVTLGLDASDFAKGAATAQTALTTTSTAAGHTANTLQSKGKTAAEFFSRVKVGSVDMAKRQAATGIALRNTSEQAGRAAREMQAKGHVAGEFFSSIKNQALSLITVLLGSKSILGTVASTTQALSAMGTAAKNIGIDVPDLAAFRNVVEANGGSADEAAAAFRQLTKNQQEYKETGTASNILGLNRIAATADDTPMEVMRKFAAYADAHKDNRAQVMRVAEQLGLGEGLANVGVKGTANLDKELGEARQRGLPTREMTENARALEAAYIKATQAGHHLTDLLVDRFAPALTKILDAITAFIEAHGDAATGIGIGATVAGGVLLPKVIKGAAQSILGTGAAAPVEGAAATGGLGAMAAGVARFFPWLAAAGIALRPSATGSADEDQFVREQGTAARQRQANGGGAPALPVEREAVRTEAHDFFAGKGLTEEQVAGVLANIKAESNFDPKAADGTGAHGLFQHQGSRWRDMVAETGTNTPTVQQQLEFAWKEMSGGGINGILAALRATRTAEDASRVVTTQFERPANADYRASQRAVMARDQLSQNVRTVQQQPGGQAMPAPANNNTTQNSTVAINGPINIQTQATDARGVAGALHGELRSRGFVAQANRGLS